ncbi:hypothetical protein LC605_27435 [Nostoc sp. CHAB 5836]|uniref:hypothetical protein n=1 Tax=Nostoc sp. CHAB 5836 TaxID=2780404 RepID=UPI001E47B45F|nr:hypothetical protein [Nostoc sp. CHAB 5836]MCC5618755.1 hypothetical protein [Nostoc sp. CHAB 5836]
MTLKAIAPHPNQPIITLLALKQSYMNKPEEKLELYFRHSTTETVSMKIPTDTLRSLEKIAASQDMSPEALLKLYRTSI